MPQKNRYMWGLQEGLQMEAIRGGYLCEQTGSTEDQTKYAPQCYAI